MMALRRVTMVTGRARAHCNTSRNSEIYMGVERQLASSYLLPCLTVSVPVSQSLCNLQ
jgi:hypothetical protein